MKINTPSNTKTVILNTVSNEMIELKNAVNEAKIKLGLSNSELSKLIGHSWNYISETLRIGASTEKQAEVISKIKDAVAVELVNRGVGVMTIEEIRKNAPSDATHYAITKITGSIIYLKKDRRVINYCDRYKTDEPLGFIKPL